MIFWRIRTEYTFGATYAPIEKIITRLNELGASAAGIMDAHGTWGHVPWFNACREAGIQPMFGVELVVDSDEALRTMGFLARNPSGLKELYHFTSKAHHQPISTKRGKFPRLYPSQVRNISDDVMIFAGENVSDPDFLKDVGAVIDITPQSMVLNHQKKQIAESHGLRVVQALDNAYVTEDDRRTLSLINDRALKPTDQTIHDCGEEENEDLLPEDFDLPTCPMISIEDADEKLRSLCLEGIEARDLEWSDEYQARLDKELSLISKKNFASYFLVVADMTRFAKSKMLVGPSRGSAAGSLVCYLTRITEIDPIQAGLIFERFIDETRDDLPDIDLDFPDAKRHLVFEYMAEKYGEENVAHIGTVSRFKARSSLVITCKRMKIPIAATGAVKANMIERSPGDDRVHDCLYDTLSNTPEGQKLLNMYPEAIEGARIEGHASHSGVHAAGLLVANESINDFCTVTEKGIAQIEKRAAEQLGLLKIDVLGLRTLTVLDEANVLSNEEWYSLPLDDPETFQVFNDLDLAGIFQFEGGAMGSVSKDMIPFRTMHDIDAVTALARPGPLMSGITQKYLDVRNGNRRNTAHPLVAEDMAHTEGFPIYQEQTFTIVQKIGGFSPAEAAEIRRLISKRKGVEFFGRYWKRFLAGARKKGLTKDEAREIWDEINTMGVYQMNKAHTYSYAVISYWEAWLKAHHPMEFVLSYLRSNVEKNKALKLIREMVSNKRIRYKPLDWSVAEPSWSVQDGALMPGIDSAKGFGPKLAQKFVESREKGTLTDQQIERITNAEKEFDILFPIESRFGSYFDGSENVAGEVTRLFEFDSLPSGFHCFLGEVIFKSERDVNEEVEVKKRGGQILDVAQTKFLDVRIADDTDQILLRVGRRDFDRLGIGLRDEVEEGDVILVRAKTSKGIRFGWINKWKKLDEHQTK